MNYGLYELLPGKIYQVRGFDLAKSSFINSDTGCLPVAKGRHNEASIL
jgi:alkyl sulfatase BDS1-like metallo-beta-lactamase superfamily hydrolase